MITPSVDYCLSFGAPRKVVTSEEMPRILGVDDFALGRGRPYGTILVDLERRCRVDVLADRTADTVAYRLEAHPGVEVISQDRDGAYAVGGRRGAPEAVHVADRFRVLVNLRDALERLVARKHPVLREVASALPRKQEETRSRASLTPRSPFRNQGRGMNGGRRSAEHDGWRGVRRFVVYGLRD